MKEVEVSVAEVPLTEQSACADTAPQVGRGRESALAALHAVAAALRDLPGGQLLPAAGRFALLAQLEDDAMRACADARELASIEPAGPEQALAGVARDVFGRLLDAYRDAMMALKALGGDPDAAQAADECRWRMVHAGAQRVKWERCAGGPAHPLLWVWIGAAYRQACPDDGSLEKSPTDVRVEHEYVRAVACFSAALEHLPPPLVAALDRLIEFVLPMLVLQHGGANGGVYLVLPELGAPPRRALRASESDADGGLRLVTRIAAGALQEVAAELQGGEVPQWADAAGIDRELLAAGVQHLLRHWADGVPVRRYRRHVLGGKLTAVRGIEDLRQLFTGESVSHLAEWEFRDVSRGGIGLAMPGDAAAPLAVGELVGILPHDGESWQLGVVRRAWREDAATRVGLEALSQRPVLASADDGLVRTEVLVCDPLLRGEAVRIAAPPNTLRAGVPVFLTASGSVQKLKPLDAALAGEGFELRAYQVL